MKPEIERLLDALFLNGAGTSPGAWNPNADVVETPEHVVVMIEMGGVDRDELDILIGGNRLVITGRRDCPVTGPFVTHHQRAMSFGPFRSELTLPCPVVPEGGEACLQDGMLIIQIAKTPSDPMG